MKSVNQICIAFAMCILAVMAGVRVAHAAEVTVNYEGLPSGPVLGGPEIIIGCDTDTPPTFDGYKFMFWDNQGTISWNSTVSICSGSTDTVATAWYIATGTGNCSPPYCYVTTYAFSIDHDVFLTDGTAIALVSPNSPPDPAWATPSPTVNTTDSESITAASALAFPPYAAEQFRYWQQLNSATTTPIGVVYQATKNSTAYIVALYGPDPCQNDRKNFESCEEEGLGKACYPLGHILQLCEYANRESNTP